MNKTFCIMDCRKGLTFCPKDLAFAFTPHNICDNLNNVGGWAEISTYFLKMKNAFGYVSLWTGCFSEDFDILDINVEFELSMPSIDSTSLSAQIHWNSVCTYN